LVDVDVDPAVDLISAIFKPIAADLTHPTNFQKADIRLGVAIPD
jgi:hypothetical protein